MNGILLTLRSGSVPVERQWQGLPHGCRQGPVWLGHRAQGHAVWLCAAARADLAQWD